MALPSRTAAAAGLAGLLLSACGGPADGSGAAASAVQAAGTPVSLPAYNVDLRQSSVSGLSSGAFMAVQFQVAFSSTLRGAGIVAGGPYYCAQGSLTTATGPCMTGSGSTNVPQLVSVTNANASAGTIDPTSNLATHRVWMFSGAIDSTVKQSVMNDLQTYYGSYVGSANVFYKKDLNAEHAMPTDYYGNACATKADPYINNCGYDAAGQLLQWIYGTLAAKNTGALGGSLIEFDQSAFIASPNSHSMANSGWLYVPARCAAQNPCKLHVVFHGCKQYPSYSYFDGSQMVTYGTTFVTQTGYNKWADTNDIIVLYPQAYNGAGNPNGCWDWWGYDDAAYAKKTGRQMAAVKAMIDRIGAGYGGGGTPPPAPTNLAVTGTSSSSISLSWSAASGAAGYNVYRSSTAGGTQTRANSALLTGTSFTDSGLNAGTTYYYVAKSQSSAGAESAASGQVSGTTQGTAPVCYYDTNYNHTLAGRAYVSFGYTYANGSNQNMGLWNVFVYTSLKKTGSNYYVIGTCP